MTLCLFTILLFSPLSSADDDSLWENLEDVPEEDKADEAEADGAEGEAESSSEDSLEEENEASEDPDTGEAKGEEEDPDTEEEEAPPPPPPTTEELLEMVDLNSFAIPIRLHEDVVAWVDWFRGPGRPALALWIKKSGKYRQMITYELKKAGLPKELLYVAMIESGFKETAESHAEAKGVWQFIPETGRRYDLRVDEWIDERCDPFLSTQAAIQYLQFLYYNFGYWPAALAGYNAGEGRVHSALFQYGTIDFWVLSDAEALPLETIDYVPKIIAAGIIDSNPGIFGFQNIRKEEPVDLVRVMVNGGTHAFQMAEAANITLDEFYQNNPHILGVRLPSDRAEYHVYVHPGALNDFTREMRRMGVDRISSGRTLSEAEIETYSPKEDVEIDHHARRFTHIVKENENINDIATQYGLNPESLSQWNDLGGRAGLQSGQELKLQAPQRTKWVSHDVSKGDSLRSIARKYDCTVEEIMKWNQLEKDLLPTKGTRLWLKLASD